MVHHLGCCGKRFLCIKRMERLVTSLLFESRVHVDDDIHVEGVCFTNQVPELFKCSHTAVQDCEVHLRILVIEVVAVPGHDR